MFSTPRLAGFRPIIWFVTDGMGLTASGGKRQVGCLEEGRGAAHACTAPFLTHRDVCNPRMAEIVHACTNRASGLLI